MNNDNQIRSEKIPSAWLVTGGRMFKDRAYISEAGAVKSAQERGDGASVEPLYLDDQLPPAPVAEELSSEPVEYQFQDDDGRWHPFMNEKHRRNTEAAGYRIRALYDHPQPAVPDVEALAEFLKVSDFFGFSPAVARDLALRICNWIEEQQQ